MSIDTFIKETNIFSKWFIIFAGAGVVKATGIPTWCNLLLKYKDVVKNNQALKNKLTNLELKTNQNINIKSDDFPFIAQEIYDNLKMIIHFIKFYLKILKQKIHHMPLVNLKSLNVLNG